MKRHLLFHLAALSALYGQSPSVSPPPPLPVGRAELLNALKTPNLKVGDLFYLRTITSWHQGDCTILPHATITGRVESLTPSPDNPRNTILALRFSEVICSGANPKLMTPSLVSIRAPDSSMEERNNTADPDIPLLRGVFPSSMDNRSDSRASDPTSTGAYEASELRRINDDRVTGKPMNAGEVRGYRGVALTLPSSGGTVAQLSCDHKLVLTRSTEFAFAYTPAPSSDPDLGAEKPPSTLVSESGPKPALAKPASPAPASPASLPAPPAPRPPPEEPEDVCDSSGCKELSAVAETHAASSLWAIPLTELGYQPRPIQHIVGLDSSASVHFLGEDQLLLTFTRHVLVPRSSESETWDTNPRSVRAVLISRTNGHVLRVKDWTVSDDIAPFAWSFGKGVVIAHIGHDLVRFGPGLSIERRFRLAGPLLFLSASPKRDLLLIATVHEKHTREEHARIASFVGPGFSVDEDYDLTGLNAELKMTGTQHLTVPPSRPALLQESMVSARRMGGVDWLLEESTWEGKSKRFAQFQSSCPLRVESFPGDLFFIQGCPPVGASTWYRVLNTHGVTLFKGSRPSTDLIQQAESSSDGRLFAIALSHFTKQAVDRTTEMQIQDYTNLTVTVYDTVTGKQCFAAHSRRGSAQMDTFSLSPSSSALAVLTNTSLELFSLPGPAPKK